MTYLHNTQERPIPPASHTPSARRIYTAALAPVRRSLLTWLWVYVCRMAAIGEADHRAGLSGPSRAFYRAAFVVQFILRFMPGSLQEQTDLVSKMITQYRKKRLALFIRLQKAYKVWRQRKCWMWGDGLMAGTLAALSNVFESARYRTSFDALIPD